MSTFYGMRVEISGFSASRVEGVKKAAEEEWPFDTWAEYKGELSSYAESSLCGGETEEEFADRLAKAVWAANNGFCLLTIDATYLHELPYETHIRDEFDYERLLKEKPS